MSLRVGVELAERRLVPTAVLRQAIRRLCAARLEHAHRSGGADALVASMLAAPLAPVPDQANAQHYELPSAFFELVLGRHLKYSSAYWPAGTASLDAAEEAMLALVCERAELRDGQEILELGCGWGSLSLYLARRYPCARILAVSNSATQRAFLETRRPANLEIVTADMNVFDPGRRFDRIVSVEMFEHMRNWPALLARLARWMHPGGRLFVHVFCHLHAAYPFETDGPDNWMGRYFFSGGLMPSYALLPRLAAPFTLERHWWLDGTHYQCTAAAWRQNLEDRRAAVMAVLRDHYGAEARRWYQRWRLFFLACEELFGYDGGRQWGVGHYRLVRP
jgi:cyclopropane-fatty-acyl-phospholipid synthase